MQEGQESESAQIEDAEGTISHAKRGIRLPIMLTHEEYFRVKEDARKAGFKTLAQYARHKLFEDANAKYGPYLEAIEAFRGFQSAILRIKP